jgi:predicted NBD/HSP70 family sugar kinase
MSEQESVQVKGSKGIVMGMLMLLAGGGVGATAVSQATGRESTEVPTPYLSRSEVEAIASGRADRAQERASADAKAYTATEVAAAREACDKRLTETVDRIGRKLDRLDQIAEDVALLKGAIRAKGR